MESLSARRVRALYLSSAQSQAESSAVYAELRQTPPPCKLLYVTPERLQHSVHLRACLQRLHAASLISRLVIDEAHCVIQWGKDFRPDYLELGALRRETLAGVPTMLLSATLPPPMRPELFEAMGIEPADAVVVEATLDRPKLHFEVWPKLAPKAAADQLASLFKGAPSGANSGIVYCHSQGETEKVSELLGRLLRALYTAPCPPTPCPAPTPTPYPAPYPDPPPPPSR